VSLFEVGKRSDELICDERRTAMSKGNLEIGDVVRLTTGEWQGTSGVVSRPISKGAIGHVLVHKSGYILGVDASMEEVEIVDGSGEGFAQLAYNLIKLGSHVIEKTLQ